MLLLPSWRKWAYRWVYSMALGKSVSLVSLVPLIPYVIVYMNTPTNTREERLFLIKNITRMRKFSHDLGNCKHYHAKGSMLHGQQFQTRAWNAHCLYPLLVD